MQVCGVGLNFERRPFNDLLKDRWRMDDGQKTNSNSREKPIIINVIWPSKIKNKKHIINSICRLTPSSGTIQLSTIKWLKVILHQFWVKNIFPWKFIWNTVVPLLSYSCIFQVEICFFVLAIVVETNYFSVVLFRWLLIIIPHEENFGPMIADQENINGCVRFAFQLSPFFKPGCQK
jgi:hypothetical protein